MFMFIYIYIYMCVCVFMFIYMGYMGTNCTLTMRISIANILNTITITPIFELSLSLNQCLAEPL